MTPPDPCPDDRDLDDLVLRIAILHIDIAQQAAEAELLEYACRKLEEEIRQAILELEPEEGYTNGNGNEGARKG